MPTSSVHVIDSVWGRGSVIVGFPQRRTFKLNSVNSSPNLPNIMCCIGNDTFAIEYPCKLHVGHSVILCLVDIEHLYRLIQCENVVLISLNRHHMRKFFMPKCYLTPVTQYWCCKRWKHCYIDRDLTLFCYLVHGIFLMKSSKRMVSVCEGNHRSLVNSPHREPATRVYFLYQSRQRVKQTFGLPVIWEDMMLIVTLL